MADIQVQGPLAIEGLQGQNFEFGVIRDLLPFRGIRSHHSLFWLLFASSSPTRSANHLCYQTSPLTQVQCLNQLGLPPPSS